jgi:hypothetical protein
LCTFNAEVTRYNPAETVTNGNKVTITLCFRGIVMSIGQKCGSTVADYFKDFSPVSPKKWGCWEKIAIF